MLELQAYDPLHLPGLSILIKVVGGEAICKNDLMSTHPLTMYFFLSTYYVLGTILE